MQFQSIPLSVAKVDLRGTVLHCRNGRSVFTSTINNFLGVGIYFESR